MKCKIFAVLFVLLFTLNAGARDRERIKKRFPVEPGGTLIIENINGSITLDTHGKEEISLNILKTAQRKSHLENIKLNFEFRENRLKVIAKRTGSPSAVRVDISLRVPENLKFLSLRTASGSIEINGRLGAIEARSVNGDIRFRGISSDTRFHVINGGIFLVFQENLGGDIIAGTVNGSIQIELTEDSSFKITGSCMNGGIRSDFDLKLENQFVSSKISGTVNRGQHRIQLEASNGSIKILKI